MRCNLSTNLADHEQMYQIPSPPAAQWSVLRHIHWRGGHEAALALQQADTPPVREGLISLYVTRDTPLHSDSDLVLIIK